MRALTVIALCFFMSQAFSTEIFPSESKMIELINSNGEFIKASTDTKSGKVTKTTYKNNIKISNGKVHYYFESMSHEKGNSLFGYMSSHWARKYEFDVCEIYKYSVISKNNMRYENDVPATGQVRLWVSSGSIERIDLDKSGGDESRPRENGGFDLEIIIPSNEQQPVKIVKSVMATMKEHGCDVSLDRNMGSEEILL